MKAITVNQNGLKAIRTFLEISHVVCEFSDSMIAAWASDIENSWAEGNGPCFEIPARYSLTGHPQIFCLSESSFDTYEVEE